MSIRRMIRVALILLVVLLLTACGSPTDPPPTVIVTATSPPTSTPAPTTAPAEQATATSAEELVENTAQPSDDEGLTYAQQAATATARGELITLNKIANPNFTTGQYTYTASDGTSIDNVPQDWEPWWDDEYGRAPEMFEERHPPHHFPEDWASWRVFTRFDMFRGGLMQGFNDLQPGAMYRANCWMFSYAGEDAPGFTSEGEFPLRLGIDPTAGRDPSASSVIWTIEHSNVVGNVAAVLEDAYEARDLFDPFQITFIATQPEATLFLWGESQFEFGLNAMWVDSCEMNAIGWADEFGYNLGQFQD